MMIGTLEAALKRRQMLKPSSPGSITSRTTRSTSCCLSRRSISCADPAAKGVSPFSDKTSLSIWEISRSSSTSRTRYEPSSEVERADAIVGPSNTGLHP